MSSEWTGTSCLTASVVLCAVLALSEYLQLMGRLYHNLLASPRQINLLWCWVADVQSLPTARCRDSNEAPTWEWCHSILGFHHLFRRDVWCFCILISSVSFKYPSTMIMCFEVLSLIWFPNCDYSSQPSFTCKDLLILIQWVYSLYVPVLLMRIFLCHTRGKLLRTL